MPTILVAGLINFETTVRVEQFPIAYEPVRYPFWGVNSTMSGVGLNIAKALKTLGNDVNLLSLIGKDAIGTLCRAELENLGISTHYVLSQLEATAQSVILYEAHGQRQINVDLKDIQATVFPLVHLEPALEDCDIAVLCNINFSRPFLSRAKKLGKIIATDVHSIARIDDDYNRDYMAHADILFMSHEHLSTTPEDFIQQLWATYETPIAVIGMGSAGALIGVREDQRIELVPAVQTRPTVNTIGAGDALFSAFVHYYHRHQDPYAALRKAVVFASYKIGVSGAADGFLTAPDLDSLADEIYRNR